MASSSPAGARSQRPGLEDEIEIEAAEGAGERAGERVGGGRGLVAVGNAEAAAAIDARDRMAGGAELADEPGKDGKTLAEGGEREDLAADVNRQTHRGDSGECHGLFIERGNLGRRDAEFVLGEAGCDLGMRARVDVRVDAERHRRGAAEVLRYACERAQLIGALDIDLADAGGERMRQLLLRLADAGEDDALGRNPGGKRAGKLALADDVGAGAEAAEKAEHGEMVVRLDRVVDVRGKPGASRAETSAETSAE